LLIDERSPETLLPINMAEQKAEAQFRPCLAGHWITLGKVQKRNVKLFEQPMLEFLWHHRLIVDVQLAFAARLTPAPRYPKLFLPNAKVDRRAIVLFSQPRLFRIVIRICPWITEQKVQSL